jgi:hypothetical protein
MVIKFKLIVAPFIGQSTFTSPFMFSCVLLILGFSKFFATKPNPIVSLDFTTKSNDPKLYLLNLFSLVPIALILSEK